MSIVSRRRLAVGGVSLLGLAGAIAVAQAAPVHPDTELMALCAAFEETEARWVAICDAAGSDDIDDHVVSAEQNALLDRMDALRATTIDGISARARTLAVVGGHGEWSLDVSHETPHGRLVIGLLRDVLLLNGLPVPPALLREARA
jgi:hypothetical protein